MPEGTIPVAIGLVITGLSAYAFLSLTRYGLGTDASTPVNQLWFATFILAPGFFLPVEQEVGRALAHRRALGEGGLPVLRKAALLALGLLAIVGIFLLIASPFLTRELFDGSWVLFGCLLLAFAGYALGHFLRGTFAGTGRFHQYGLFMASDGLIRFTACAVLAVTGVTFLGAYGLLVGIPPFLAVFIALRGNYHLTPEGPPAEWGELTPNLGWLVAGSVAAAALVNAGPLAAKLLADDTQSAIVSEFSYAVLVARVPLFMFQAVQAALLPKLARLAAQGLFDDFRQGFRRLMQVVVVVGLAGVVLAATIGPTVLEIVFNASVSRRTLTLLALGSGMYMIGLGIAQAVIALHGHAWAAVGWIAGLATFIVVTAVASHDLLLRVGARPRRGVVDGHGHVRVRPARQAARRRARRTRPRSSTPSPTTHSKPPDRTGRVTTPRVAIDVGSLHGPQTGVGQFVTRLLDGLAGLDEPPDVLPYVLSFRAELRPGVRRLRYPATAALRAWGRLDRPRRRPRAGRQPGRARTQLHRPAQRAPHRRVGARLLVPAATRRGHGRGPALRRRPAARRRPGGDGPRALAAHRGPGAGAARGRAGGGRPAGLPDHAAPGRRRCTWPASTDVPTCWPLGAKEPRKNLPRLIDAFGLLQRQLPELALVLARPGRSRRAGHRRGHQPPAPRRGRPHPARRLRERRRPQRHPPRRRRRSPTRRSTRASASRRWRPWPPACRSWPPTPAPCRRSAARRPSWSTRATPRRWPPASTGPSPTARSAPS